MRSYADTRHTGRRLFTTTTHGETTGLPLSTSPRAASSAAEGGVSVGEQVIVGGDPRTRYFNGWLRTLIGLRDQYCRHPYCTAPIRHSDHIRRWADGGETSLINGQGLCERHNHTKDLPGWHSHTDGGPPTAPHIRVTTPTGHIYTSRAPEPP